MAEEQYAARFVNNGHPAHPARMALGALLIQRRLKCSDQWLVKHIGENPYLQYFIGMKEYGSCPFGASTLVAFRKRFSEEDLAAILEVSVPKTDTEDKDDTDDGNDPPNRGTLVLDATCCPADIAYPQDIDLLNQAQEKAEKTVDELCKMSGQKPPGCTASVPGRTTFVCPKARNAVQKRFVQRYENSCNTSAGT